MENNPDHVFYISCHTFCVGYTNQKTADVVIGGWWDLCHTFSAYQKRDSMGTLFIRGGSRLYFFRISKMTRESFGYGDSLLILLLGVAVGFWNLISLLAIAFFLSAVVSAAALVFGKFHRKTTVPFVPFLGIGYFFVRVLGGVG